MAKSFYIIIPLIFINIYSNAKSNQDRIADSLISSLHEFKNDTNKVNLLIEITNALNEINYEKAIYYGNKAIELSKELKYDKGVSNTLFYLAWTYYYMADYKSTMANLLEKMKIDEELGNKRQIANNYNFIGNIYYSAKDYEKAFENYKKGLSIYEELNDSEGARFIYNNLANIYVQYNELQKAEENYKLSLNIGHNMNNYRGLAITYNNLGNLYYKYYKNKKAITYFNKAIEFVDSINTNKTKVKVLVYNNIGDYYIWANNYDSALVYLYNGYLLAKQYYLPSYKNDIAASLSKIYSKKENYKKAFEYQLIHKKLSDSIFSIDNSGRLTLLEFQYEQKKKEIQHNITLLKQQRKTKTSIWTATTIFLISVASAVSYIVYQRGKIREGKLRNEKIKIEAESLSEKLEFRNKEIVLMMMNLFERNELINQVINKLRSVLPNLKKTNYNFIDDIVKDLRGNYHENILKEFEYRFQKVHTNFFRNIRKDFNNLTSNDLRLCAFLKLNMSTKDIASITHQSINSIEVARTRLRKKLNLNNVDIDLVAFLAAY